MMFTQFILNPLFRNIEQYAERNAFCFNRKFYTYRQLGEKIDIIRGGISSRSFHNKVVGLVANDDIETYASIFALWSEGCAYVPLHPEWPIDRTQDIVNQVEMDLILDSSTDTRYDENIVLYTKSLNKTINKYKDVETEDSNIAYILFTSGSTGKPKGVMISREAIAEFVRAYPLMGAPELNCEDRTLQCFDLTFDLSIQGYLLSTLSGGCCYTIPYGQVKYMYSSILLEDEKITVVTLVPSMLRYMEPYFGDIDASSLRCCTVTAEAVHYSLIKKWKKCAPNTIINNMCGATETTINCTYYLTSCDENTKTYNDVICVGKPMDGSDIIIIDEDNNILKSGDKGEICYSGKQITSGYQRNEKQNKKAFFYKEINGQNIRFYHSGDLGYIDDEGDLFHCGRLDNQVKVQGYRVELGEIECHARKILNKTLVCASIINDKGIAQIAMFVETDSLDLEKLKMEMKKLMPDYMIPTYIVCTPVFPLNSNGKIDKNELRKLIQIQS